MCMHACIPSPMHSAADAITPPGRQPASQSGRQAAQSQVSHEWVCPGTCARGKRADHLLPLSRNSHQQACCQTSPLSRAPMSLEAQLMALPLTCHHQLPAARHGADNRVAACTTKRARFLKGCWHAPAAQLRDAHAVDASTCRHGTTVNCEHARPGRMPGPGRQAAPPVWAHSARLPAGTPACRHVLLSISPPPKAYVGARLDGVAHLIDALQRHSQAMQRRNDPLALAQSLLLAMPKPSLDGVTGILQAALAAGCTLPLFHTRALNRKVRWPTRALTAPAFLLLPRNKAQA